MKLQSAKEKGKRFERFIAEQIQESGIDSNAGREIGSGSGKRKGDIHTSMDFLIEAKNQENPGWLGSIDQAKGQAKIGYHNSDKWLLVVRDPRSPEFQETYAVMDFQQFLMLYKKAMEPKSVNPDRSLLYKAQRVKQAISDFMKELK